MPNLWKVYYQKGGTIGAGTYMTGSFKEVLVKLTELEAGSTRSFINTSIEYLGKVDEP